ncbi:MAG TPA: DbpA RNA binding domain-containing protein [Gemmatimonadales bacterium]|nr:DbpA RNA binding domain-containing protein [Gemmatimonadales bacterium]
MKGERSRHTVFVVPPAVARVGKAWELIDSRAVVVCADYEQASLWADAAPPECRAHPVTGLTRTAALLKEGRVGLLAGSPADLAALVARAALKLETVETILIAWPESFADQLDALLAEAPNARRVILSWNPPAISEFLERHGRRAEVVGDMPLDPDGKPLGPVGSAQYAVIASQRRDAAVREVLDALRATRPYVWRGGDFTPQHDADVLVAAALPSRTEMQALIAPGIPAVVLALAAQVPYLRSIAVLTPLTLSGAADRAQDRGAALRALLAERLARGDVDAELAMLAPLFQDHDPALVAGALLALQRETGNEKRETSMPQPTQSAGWVRLFVTAGTKDRASAKDLVGALIKEAGLQKGQIGKVDVRETFSLVDVAPGVAEQAARRLSGVSIRGRRVTARPDRA